jgi:hypothetical protein
VLDVLDALEVDDEAVEDRAVEDGAVEEDLTGDTDEDAIDDALLALAVAEPLVVVVEGMVEDGKTMPGRSRFCQSPQSRDENDPIKIRRI